jgi:hypothetical protein
LKAKVTEPVTLYIGDLDNNGGADHILSYYNEGTCYPFISRDQLVKQVPMLKRKFLKYENFRNVKMEDIIPLKDTARFRILRAYEFASMYIENRRGEKFVTHALPAEAQMFPIFSFASGDFNDDGSEDVLGVGNLYAVQPDFGRYDAGYGLMMLGDGKGKFRFQSPSESGFIVDGEGRDVKFLKSRGLGSVYIVARNDDSVLTFSNTSPAKTAATQFKSKIK